MTEATKPGPQVLRVKNLGAIEEGEYTLSGPGVTVLRGPQGVGKTTLLEAVQSAATGKGRPPLRDGEKTGWVDVGGALITLGAKVTRNGEFELTNLEGRFDLSKLVDPGIQNVKSADNHRIKALVTLTGATADPARFKVREEFKRLEEIVPPEALESDDLVDMAARIKRAYEAAAIKSEDQAKHEEGHAKGCEEAAEGLNLEAEYDATVLRKAYDAARDELTTLKSRRREWEGRKEKADAARKVIEGTELPDLDAARESLGVASDLKHQAEAAVKQQSIAVEELVAQLREARNKLDLLAEKSASQALAEEAAMKSFESAKAAHANVAEQRKLIDDFAGSETPDVTDAMLTDAEIAVSAATKANDEGTLIRDAREKKAKAAAHRESAKAKRQEAESLRSAAKTTDHVLSEAIESERFRVKSMSSPDGKESYAVMQAQDDEHGGEWVPYARLSDGQRWHKAIDEGADRVGEGGILVIPQGAWGELTGKTKREVHEHAEARGVYILTAEATPKEEDEERGLEAVAFGEKSLPAG